MPEDTTVKSTFIQNVKDLFEDIFGGPNGYFKTFWYGDPVEISEAQLPALVIDETAVHYVAGPTMMDDVEHDVLIQVVLNKKDELGKPKTEAPMSKRLAEIVHGRDPATSQLLPKSIIGVLRTNITMKGVSVHQQIDVDFGVMPRPNNVVTAEAHVKVTMQELVYVVRTS